MRSTLEYIVLRFLRATLIFYQTSSTDAKLQDSSRQSQEIAVRHLTRHYSEDSTAMAHTDLFVAFDGLDGPFPEYMLPKTSEV